VTAELRLYLSHLLEGGSPYDDEISHIDRDPGIRTIPDAIATATAFRDAPDESKDAVLRLFFNPGSQEAYSALYQLGIPEVHRHALALGSDRAAREKVRLMPFVRALVAFGHPPSMPLVESLGHDAKVCEDYGWGSVFQAVNLSDPESKAYIDAFTKRLPDGYAAVAFLDWANQGLLDGDIGSHPFDSPAGRGRLAGYLADTDPENFSHAVSATVALAFVNDAALLETADAHPDPGVRIEAAWARARRGEEEGIRRLAELCLDWRTRARSMRYLEELEHADRIPESVRDPRESAVGRMAEWLEHPNELGELPDQLEILDHRTIHWPPAGGRIPVTLLRWRKGNESGTGMTGSVTWCFFSEDLPGHDPLEVYAKHCKWEMEAREVGEGRKAADRTEVPIETARKLLTDQNPEEDWAPTR
jgi:hypothetical protein